VFGVYVALYTVGRLWIEALRVDTANHVLGLRLNIWTAVLVGIAATAATVLSARRRPGREEPPLHTGTVAEAEPDAGPAVENSPAHQTTPES
jgi:prolipoprotein diacylglyceryltransferase